MSEFDQSNLDLSTETPSGSVECLGQTFESDDARRKHYTELLREKLKDPEFRKIEGFPIGEDEDILALSDPPYYTACPNPWIEDFVKHHGRPYDPNEEYHREPFAADVSEGKNHPIYNAHSYHTKVPHRAIMRYILHYTEPGDVVFDGFCGTGMTGIAAQLCGDKNEVQELCYRVDQLGIIYDEDGKAFSKLGARKAVLGDLSTAATFIAYNYNTPLEIDVFEKEASRIVSEVEKECGWMYLTLSEDDREKAETLSTMVENAKTFDECKSIFLGKNSNSSENQFFYRTNCIIWSDLFLCPETLREFSFWDVAIDFEKGKIKDTIVSPFSGEIVTKKNLDRVWEKYYDKALDEVVSLAKQKPALIVYYSGKKRKRKKADKLDIALSQKIRDFLDGLDFPKNELPIGEKMSDPRNLGVNNIHQFYTSRNLYTLSVLLKKINSSVVSSSLKYQFNSCLIRQSRMSRLLVSYFFHGGGGWVGGPISLTLYIPSFSIEVQPFETWRNRTSKSLKGLVCRKRHSLVTTGSSTSLQIPNNSLDYLFIDPPFGGNIMYSELNIIWESWLKVMTENTNEAICSNKHKKTLSVYQSIIAKCFKKLYDKLKPGRWLTCEFSNTKASVWNSIQTSLQEAGFVVANVSALDKKQGSFNAVTNTTSVKQDLVISAYKPSEQLELFFSENGDSVEGVWQFIDSHLKQLPVSKPKGGSLEFVAERDPRILYDRMVAFYIGHNTPVPLSSGEFQAALDDKYPARDGMVFLPEQVAQYDKLAAKMESVGQMVVFVEDEKSAIGWLRQYLKDKPSTYQGIHPDFTQQLSASWRKFETRPELSVLLDQNFLKYSGEGDVPSQIHGYLSTDYHDLRKLEKDDPKLKAKAKDRWYVPDPKKMADVEAQREKKLLAEFWEYAAQAGFDRGQTQTSQASLQLGDSAKKKPKVKKLKEVRTDAVRAGFMECQRSNQGAVILAVAEILPANVIEEDEQLQMIYDMAEMRAG